MRIEFLPWYQPGGDLVRCGGDDGCGSLIVEGDIEVHRRWHERIVRLTLTTPRKGVW